MKKLFIYFILFIPISYSQGQIPNSGFEDWNTGVSGVEPVNWITTNAIFNNMDQITGSLHPSSVIKAANGHTGNYGITMQNVVGTLSGAIIDTVPGIVSAITNSGKEGFPVSQRYNSLNGFYKFTQGSNGGTSKIDTSLIIVTVSKWNPMTRSREVIGKGLMNFYENTSLYTPFNILIEYTTGLVPDSAQITIMSSSAKKRFPGTSLTIDDISLGGGTNNGSLAIRNSISSSQILTYPNPATTEVNLKNLPEEASIIELRDLSGKTILTIPVTSDFSTIKTNGLSSGVYMYSVLDTKGELLGINKVLIEN